MLAAGFTKHHRRRTERLRLETRNRGAKESLAISLKLTRQMNRRATGRTAVKVIGGGWRTGIPSTQTEQARKTKRKIRGSQNFAGLVLGEVWAESEPDWHAGPPHHFFTFKNPSIPQQIRSFAFATSRS
jgi:hypothetical protein